MTLRLSRFPQCLTEYLSGAPVNLHLPSAEPHETLPTPAGRSGGVDFPYGPKGPADKGDPKDNARFQLLKYIGLGLKHRYLVSAICIVFLFGGFINTMLTTKIYSAYTTIKIDRAVQRVVKDRDSDSEIDQGERILPDSI